ncbi:hypothetical protein EW146_g3800 [Bondarzewia mesenterica]|uniref:Uncharacterized protein n=1 Tax=Bondarzewia mesenterica TaxID=1095465 RepID=A0A4S4M2B1_9AGAM|nr:hypothetical protein EW146_g3800 [Bondarzewia mesenterica]
MLANLFFVLSLTAIAAALPIRFPRQSVSRIDSVSQLGNIGNPLVASLDIPDKGHASRSDTPARRDGSNGFGHDNSKGDESSNEFFPDIGNPLPHLIGAIIPNTTGRAEPIRLKSARPSPWQRRGLKLT